MTSPWHGFVKRTAWLPPSLVLVVLVAGAAGAQMPGHHAGQPGAQAASGMTLDEAVKELASPAAAKRLQAVKALGTSKDSKAVYHLIKALGDSDLRVQAKAVQILGDMRATEATPILVERLMMRTTDSGMKHLIIVSLGKIGDGRAARPLIQLLQRDLDVEMRGTAIFALGEIGSPEAVEVLEHIETTDEEPTVRRVANEARGKIEARHGMANSPLTSPAGTP
jgi:HEAT repeat protein